MLKLKENPNYNTRDLRNSDLYLEVLVRCIPDRFKIKKSMDHGFDYTAEIGSIGDEKGKLTVIREYDRLNSRFGGGNRNTIKLENDEFSLDFVYE